ncbi:MAG: YraN family protein [Treponema sp.]|jgi:putative endonuclease|nr:YraN family protein [Treponema sp.]
MPKKGREGEAQAAAFLEKKGMQIVEQNFRHSRGEVDIIALDGDTLVFVEVKSWQAYGIDALEYAIDNKKRRKIIETSKYFLSLHREYKYMIIRFDVVFISSAKIIHLASAFTEGV